MRQYHEIKQQHPNALLLFRVGDFYETFFEDAIIASGVLNIVLTKRANGSAASVPLAGFPHHAIDTYLPKLVRAGHRVAICNQLEDPKMTKGIVKRGVTELVTPGVAFHDQVLAQRDNNYLASIFIDRCAAGITLLDVSTGEFLVAQGDFSYIEKLLDRFKPTELLFNKLQEKYLKNRFLSHSTPYGLDEWIYDFEYACNKLNTHFGTTSLKGFGIAHLKLGITAASATLQYLEETIKKDIRHIISISRLDEDKYVWLDKFTINNLELLNSPHEEGVTLLHILDKTVTPMGARLIKQWILLPLRNVRAINERLNRVEALLAAPSLAKDLKCMLKLVGDIERLVAKVAVGRINPRELLALSKGLAQVHPIQQQLQSSDYAVLKELGLQLVPCDALLKQLNNTLLDVLPFVTNQGGLIKTGVDDTLDALHEVIHTSRAKFIHIQREESRKTGIPTLKVAHNKVFGYYLEVTHTHKAKVPTHWIRKQTLANAERYITDELKHCEERIMQAEDKQRVLEERLYRDLVEYTATCIPHIQKNARVFACLDCYLSFTQEAALHHYVKPCINEGSVIDIQSGRHPVIEQQLPVGEAYISNDVYLDNATQQIMVITGPNMSGKSALLRQVALIVLMAHMGAFVPAKCATIGLVDKIFTRVGASDNLARGESTFMMEMTETASILNNMGENSLIIMDEIGRGTSTYDGLSIAWAILEYLHDHSKHRTKTLFATHYHELSQLGEQLVSLKNFNVSVEEIDGRVLFLRKLREGGSTRSFGIHVAKIAGIPPTIVRRARELLQTFESNEMAKTRMSNSVDLAMPKSPSDGLSPMYLRIKSLLSNLVIDDTSPIEALLHLKELKAWYDEEA